MRRLLYRFITIQFAITIGMVVFGLGRMEQLLRAQSAPQPSPAPHSSSGGAVDDLQRSYKINTYRVAAESGIIRGETIYYYKCWMCHNKFTIAANHGPAPYLQDLYKMANLPISGDPVNEATLTAVIKDGNPMMPSFRTALSDSDVADLVSYLRSGKCCEEGEDPPPNPWYAAQKHNWPVQTGVSGGARGSVRTTGSPGDSREGVKVQLIAPNGVRTTVYTKEDGSYEFPEMKTGEYTLRIATPLQFKPYRRSVQIEGTKRLEDIVLESATLGGIDAASSDAEALPAIPEIEAQLSGAEILWNLPGTGQEKDTFRKGCGSGCHSYPQILRNRYDARSWALIVDRMFNYGNAILLSRVKGTSGRGSGEGQKIISNWLAKVRGPESVDAPLHVFPRPRGASTRVVVTEYELPRQLLSAHDVSGDSKGNIWYTSHKSRFFGKLDPRTGIITEYSAPAVLTAVPGTHRIVVDQKRNDVIWISEPWAKKLTKFDPHTGEFTQLPLNMANFNFALAPDGFIWGNSPEGALKIDPETGNVLKKYPMDGRGSYDNIISDDGNFWAGGGPSTGGNYAEILDVRTGQMRLLDTGSSLSGPSRGGFDPYGNAWFGGKNASLVEIDNKAGKMREYVPPTGYTPYTDFYEAMPDKNGEIWAGVLHGRGMLRYNPHTDRWTEYALPEPFGHDRRTWIDNTTTPVTVWYVDYQGYIVRIQPLE
jgi:virginiamycin B lyase